MPYAAIDLHYDLNRGTCDVEIVDDPQTAPTCKRPSRDDIRVDETVIFFDWDRQTRSGRIVRLNLKTATIDIANGQWRALSDGCSLLSKSDRPPTCHRFVERWQFADGYGRLNANPVVDLRVKPSFPCAHDFVRTPWT